MNEDLSSKIHDIKDIVEIPDNSIFIFIALLIIGTLLLISIIAFLIKLYKNKKINKRKEYFKVLESLTFNNSKNDAYVITKYVRLLARNKREIKLSNELIEELEESKYKKEVKSISNETKAKLSTFMDVVDV